VTVENNLPPTAFTLSAITVPPAITVTSPVGGESLLVGASHNITWSTQGRVGNVRIEYSTNGGGTWTTIIAETDNDGLYAWPAPNAVSDSCLVRVSEAADGAPSDVSDSAFAIQNVPTITVTAPNGAEIWYIGANRDITWTSTGTVGAVRIEYSSDGGSNWNVVADSTDNDGAHAWTVPDSAATTYLVRISEAIDGDPRDVSDAPFTVEIEPTLTLTSPIGGETWHVGSVQAVTWQSAGAVDSIRIDMSTDGGTTWIALAPKAPDSGTYSLVVPNTVSADCRVRIGDWRNQSVTDESDASFAIEPPALVLGRRAVPEVTGLLGIRADRRRGTVSIAYGLAAPEVVTVRLYTLSGALVAAPAPSSHGPGYHTFEWQTTGDRRGALGAGMYSVHVKLGSLEYRKAVSVVK